ncbi:hypothetical protein [Sinomicrobium sp. M5D2P9]
MILLLSTIAGDASFPGIIDWLEYYEADYYILNGEDIFVGREKINVEIKENNIKLEFESFDRSEVNVIFSRRWLQADVFKHIKPKYPQFEKILTTALKSEFYSLSNFIVNQFPDAYWIPKNNRTSVNKLQILQTAIEVGLKVPETIITTSKKTLSQFWNLNNKLIISKAIEDFSVYDIPPNMILQPMYTKLVSEDYLDQVADSFFPTLFQEYIEKEHEYRVIYFEGKVYASLILSQENDETVIDSRQASTLESSPRIMPIELPKEINLKVNEFMKKINLNIGAIDLLYGKNGEYYFLEVNPVGQFEAYSRHSNYDIQKKIVEFMIKKDHEKRN